MSKLPPLDRLLQVLPAIPELGSLRESLLAVSEPDPALAWSSTLRYATYDKRVVPPAALAAAVAAAREAATQRVARLYGGIQAVLQAALEEDDGALVAGLIELGEAAEAAGEEREASACYTVAASLSAPLADRSSLMLALRRLARARLARGELETARALYRASLEQATLMDDVEGRAIALTGVGNVLMLQGGWHEAADHYAIALQQCAAGPARLRGQLQTNLATVAREEGRLADAADWLDVARGAWSDFTDADRCGWHNLAGLVALSRADHETATSHFAVALELAPGDAEAAMVLDNVAELALLRERFDDAEASGRRAEQHALAAGSPRILAEIYTRLGMICSARMDANGVTFFEKALELAVQHDYPLLEATACTAYAAFRARLGDDDEAHAYRARAEALTARASAALA
jgi:tetratricopeptide (TPR) repeat protein